MTTEKMEWVEIIEPKTKEHMYANLTTGECVWDPPVGVPVKKTDNKQWWELFDQNTGRFYYYNATSQKTVWHRPQNCDIIPLAKLQTLKQNTEPANAEEGSNDSSSSKSKSKESVATQTPGRSSIRPPSSIKISNSITGNSGVPVKAEIEGSPRGSRHHHHHHHRHGHQEGCKSGDARGRRGSQGSWRRNAQSQEPSQGAQNRSPGQNLDSLEPPNAREKKRDSGRSSDSSSVSRGTDMKPSLAPSPSTPLLKKRSPSQTKANSFDINISVGGGYSLGQENRSGGSRSGGRILTGSASNHGIARSQSFAQKQKTQDEEEDSMHEKYFISGRRSADSPMEKENATKSVSKLSPDYANFSTLPQKIGQDVLRHAREASGSDIDEVNGLSLGGAWGTSLSRKNQENIQDTPQGVKRLDQGTQSCALDNRASSAGQFLPLHHYILEQAKLSGCYRFGGLPEETDSLNSDDEPGAAPGMDYDSDEFADDEAVGDDSSSQEPLDDDEIDDPPYINTTTSRYSDHHYSDAADYTDSGPELGSSLYCNTRMSQHTVRPTHPPTTPPPPGWRFAGRGDSLHETQHTSLKRLREPAPPQPSLYSPIMERSELRDTVSHSLPCSPSPFASTGHYEHLSRLGLGRERKLPSESDIEKYAQDNLNIHKKGIFRKKFSVRELLSWSKDPIRQPMLVLSDKALKKEASEVFKMVQGYMGDRKLKQGQSSEQILLEISSLAHAKPPLRDELFIQICRQTTENPRRDSLIKGWELMAICLYFFPPSPKFQAYLESYMNRHRDPSYEHFPEVGKWPIHVQISHYASVSCKRLQRIGSGGKRPIRKPTLDEIEQARVQIFRPSMFGSTLEEVMELQKSRFPHYKLPWVQTTLSDEVLRLQGTHTEGIFRVSADVDEVTSLKQQLDRWDRPSEYTDAHTPASLLKLWYRELYEPLIPDSLYDECIQHHDDAEQAAAIVETLPALNKMVLAYLIRFLQIFARPEVVAVTKMDASNLAMVMAPNCLRCCCQEPRVMYENARKEMAFIRTLILSMDTAFMQGVL